MKELKDWNGHHVLVVPDTTHTLVRMVQLRNDLGLAAVGRKAGCALCPAWDATRPKGLQCTVHGWYLSLPRGGCWGYFVIAEEYISLAQIRLGEQT